MRQLPAFACFALLAAAAVSASPLLADDPVVPELPAPAVSAPEPALPKLPADSPPPAAEADGVPLEQTPVLFPVPRAVDNVGHIPSRQRGPEGVPGMLPGVWHITLCLETGQIGHRHCWIRYQNVHTGEVHTLARFLKGRGGWKDRHGRLVATPATVAGLLWDNDLKRECQIRHGRIHMLNIVRTNPCIYRGWNNGYGHNAVINNCATWCRDAWEYYTGEDACMPPFIHTTGRLHASLNRMHPRLALPGRVIMLSR